MTTPILAVENLQISVRKKPGLLILRGVSFTVHAGETLAIVGESGCGKSMTSLAIMGLLPDAVERTAGSVRFKGRELPITDNRAMRKVRAVEIGMVFQEPMAALDPLYPVGKQVLEVIEEHEQLPREMAWKRVIDLLTKVDLPNPEALAWSYPHKLSGGQLQRVVIAMALACNPDVLIADEPTTALDVTVQAQIMRLLKRLQRDTGVAIVLITHNLGLVAHTADRVMVMYAGNKAEEAPTRDLFLSPRHPYSRGLLDATPNPERAAAGGGVLREIPGTVPSIADPMPGCRFAPRCPNASDLCRARVPEPTFEGAHGYACFHPVARETLT
ncbi:peptide ABC transporter ATP-binding protein [Pararhodobacter marinus]|uniref:Peptide ABC transporter ATP-binding protein n=1 Tax=Pararhodobacter marinus TaxID=2184063 RepID=A0A2U2CD49_9RHOB|nr:ABC transporter ATP-binding protein [Pararhodobacter marinus]PWE29772.1 peptide ABC transporter ATP-binding protein [Pararhodobacter marinus]